MDFSTLSPLATFWLQEAGDLALSLIEKGYGSTLKADTTPVTEIDQAVEDFLRRKIGEHFPDHGIVGEERGGNPSRSSHTWLIDPIDGTRALLAGFPTFTILLALSEGGIPCFGAMYQPITRELWLGQPGAPSLRNSVPLKTRTCFSFRDAFFSTTSPLLFEARHQPTIAALINQCRACQFGGDAYAYGKLAAGQVDLIIESGLKPYDFMALTPIIEGAGGLITDWNGKPLNLTSDGSVCAAGDARLHELALSYLDILNR